MIITLSAVPASIGRFVVDFLTSVIPLGLLLSTPDTPFEPTVQLIPDLVPSSMKLKSILWTVEGLSFMQRLILPVKALKSIANLILSVLKKSSQSGSTLGVKDVLLVCVGYSSFFIAIFILYQFSKVLKNFARTSRWVILKNSIYCNILINIDITINKLDDSYSSQRLSHLSHCLLFTHFVFLLTCNHALLVWWCCLLCELLNKIKILGNLIKTKFIWWEKVRLIFFKLNLLWFAIQSSNNVNEVNCILYYFKIRHVQQIVRYIQSMAGISKVFILLFLRIFILPMCLGEWLCLHASDSFSCLFL